MSWINKTIRALSLNCKEAIRLQSEALDRPVSPWRRAGLRLHLLLCKWCRRYGRQIAFLQTIARDCDHAQKPVQTLSPEARERIKRVLNVAGN